MTLKQWAAWAFERVTGWRWHRKLRRETGEVYMDRWQLLRSRRLSVYINRINLPDADPLPHNHPWVTAYSLKLWGSYTEDVYELASVVFERMCKATWLAKDGLIPLRRRPPRWSRIPSVHRIVRLTDEKPCWTLFIGLGAKQAWGFVERNGAVIPHKARKEQRGIPQED